VGSGRGVEGRRAGPSGGRVAPEAVAALKVVAVPRAIPVAVPVRIIVVVPGERPGVAGAQAEFAAEPRDIGLHPAALSLPSSSLAALGERAIRR
jgi:hypothetical protein